MHNKTIKELAEAVYANAVNKGWYEDGKATNIGERIALIHSEVSEALEADRNHRYCSIDQSVARRLLLMPSKEGFKKNFEEYVKDTFEDEIADIVIRCMDMSEFKNFDLELHILLKMRYNALREKMHGGKKY